MTIPHYKIIEVGGKNLVVFYPQFKDDEGYKIIDLENRFPIELKNEEEYKMFLEAIIASEDAIKDGLKTLADLVDEMSLLAKGPKGDTRYMWVKYADDDKGSGMSDNPDGKKYIGMAFNKDIETPSDNASDYKWVKYVADYEGLEIGGRNFIKHSHIMELPDAVFGDDENGRWYQFRSARADITDAGVFKNRTQYTLSLELEAEEKNTRIQIEYTDGSVTNLFTGKHVFTTPKNKTVHVVRITFGRTEDVKLFNPSLVRGNVPMDWSPAPEDIFARIDNVDKAHVGLGNVQNYGIASQSQAENGTSNNAYMTPLRTKQAIEKLSPSYVIDTEIGDDYILKKFSDGTMELSGMQEFNDVSYNSAGAIYRSDGLNVDYPVEFADDNVCVTLSSSSSGHWVDMSGIGSATGFPFRSFSYNSDSLDFIVRYQAVGRWR